MPINVYTGLMRSGKSYEVVSEVVVPAIREGRRVVTNIDGISQDAIHMYLKVKHPDDDELTYGLVVHVENAQVFDPEFFPYYDDSKGAHIDTTVQPGDLVCIDEAWRFWGSTDCKIHKNHRSFFLEHGHFTHPETRIACDLVLMIQDMNTLNRFVKNVVAFNFRTHKKVSLGMNNTYSLTMWEGFKQSKATKIGNWVRTYKKDVFPLYSSFKGGGKGVLVNADKRQNVLASKKLLFGLVVGVVAAYVCITNVVKFFNPGELGSDGKPLAKHAAASPAKGAQAVAGSAGALPPPGQPVTPQKVFSESWRVVGSFQAKGVSWVVVQSQAGIVRLESPSQFSGSGLVQIGEIDGSKVTIWTGAAGGGKMIRFALALMLAYPVWSGAADFSALKNVPVKQPTRFDFRALSTAQAVQLIYAEAMPGSYVIDPEVIKDERPVSFRYDGLQPLQTFVSGFFDSLGLVVMRRGSIDYISRKAAPVPSVPDEEVLVYRPRFRDGSYLVEMLGPLFKGSFTAKRSIRAAPGDTSSGRTAPAGSAAAMIDRKSDAIVFSGSPLEVARLRKLLAQVDDVAGDVLVRGVLYEVQTTKKDGSAFGLAVNLLGGKLGISVGSVAAGPGDMLLSFKNKTIDAVLSALASDSRFKAVSKPMLRVSSGGSGRFTVGQDVPVLGAVSYPGNGQPAVQSVTYQSSGVIYDVQPVIHDDLIDLSVMQQVSNFVTTSTGVSGSPTLIKRELKSDLSLLDGEIVVMGGLTDSKDTNASQGLSFLPEFFRSKSSDTSGVEILLILQVTKL